MAQRRKTEDSITNYNNFNNYNNQSDFNSEFQNVASEVAKLYQKALTLQPVSFDAGRKNALTKAFDWISSQTQEGKSITSADVIAYVQNELNSSSSTNPNQQLETSAQRSGLNESETSQDAQIVANAASSSSTSIENQEKGENENVPQDMEEDSAP